MARSKDVYAVLGLLCLDEDYREDFFEDPHAAAKKLVGSLTHKELAQIKRIAGLAGIKVDRAEYVRGAKHAFNALNAMIQCPIFPCPDVDPWDA
jgi:hypothetical protein